MRTLVTALLLLCSSLAAQPRYGGEYGNASGACDLWVSGTYPSRRGEPAELRLSNWSCRQGGIQVAALMFGHWMGEMHNPKVSGIMYVLPDVFIPVVIRPGPLVTRVPYRVPFSVNPGSVVWLQALTLSTKSRYASISNAFGIYVDR